MPWMDRIESGVRSTSKDALKAAKALQRTLSRIRCAGQVVGTTQDQSPLSRTSAAASHSTPFSGISTTSSIEKSMISEVYVETNFTSAVSNGSEVTGNTSPWLDDFTSPRPWPPAEQGTFEAPFETMINATIELDWVSNPFQNTGHKEILSFNLNKC